MQIGQAAQASGASAKMIRHYEFIGLIAPAERRDSNYRLYSSDDVGRLKFIRRARDLGFSIDRIRDLLALWTDRRRSSAEVKGIALAHIAELEERIAGMRDMVATLHRSGRRLRRQRQARLPHHRRAGGAGKDEGFGSGCCRSAVMFVSRALGAA